MRKICFGLNISATNGKMTNLTDSNVVKEQLQKVYRLPNGLIDINGCFQNCLNFVSLEAEIPNSVKYMSSSFEGCEKFFKNISIPEECIDMTKSFKGSGVKGTITIPKNVVDMPESFKGSKIEKINFLERVDNDNINNMKESFKDCSNLLTVEGFLPSSVDMAGAAFSNSGIKNINFLKEQHYINSADGMFEGCPQLNNVVNHLYVNKGDNIFRRCSNLQYVNNIKGNSFINSWNGCSNLKAIGVISGDLNFNNTFVGVDNYSNAIYLNPTSLNLQDSDKSFLDITPLRIYGTGHGLGYELSFQNAHNYKGDYISGYCDPDDFENITDNCFLNYQGNNNDLYIPRYFRSNILDDSTKYHPVFNGTFKNKIFNNVYIDVTNIGDKTFENTHINSLKIGDLEMSNSSFCNTFINDLNIYGTSINIGNYAFLNSKILSGKIGISEGRINSIGNNAFQDTQGSLEFISNDIGMINDSAFYNYQGNINSNYSGNIIGNNAFYNATIQNGINLTRTKNIGENAFYNSDIKQLNIPDNINLATNAFYGMNLLTDLNIYDLNAQYFGQIFPSSLKNVVMRNTVQNVESTQLLKSVQKITMLNGGDVLDNQFMGLSNLKYFYSKNNPNIGNNSFTDCFNLYTISNVGNVLNYAFSNCFNLNYLNSTGHIGVNALKNCLNLQHLEAKINSYMFNTGFAHIGQLWGDYEVIYNSPTQPREVVGNEIFISQYNAPYYDYLYINMSQKLINSNIYLTSYSQESYVNRVFANIKTLKNIDFSYGVWGNRVFNIVIGCDNLINYNINQRSNWYLPDPDIIKGANNIKNINFNFAGGRSWLNATDDSVFQRTINYLSSIPTLNNVNFGSIGFNNLNSVTFNNLNVYNYSSNITVLPDVYNGRSRNGEEHSNFYSNFIIPTKYIGINSHPIWDSGNVTFYYRIPNYSMNLNNKIIYFDNHINLYSSFFNNRQNISVYFEESISSYPYDLQNASNITIYYSKNLVSFFNGYVTEISNDGKNYYYTNNINVIYEPNYNYKTYVSKIR